MNALRLAVLGLLLIFCGCGQSTVAVAPQPREPDSHAIGYYCRMTLTEHLGPKGQILLKGWDAPLWFTSVHDAFTYIAQDLVNENELAAFWVNDMGQGTWEKPAPGSWIEAKNAFYVIESQKSASMGGNEAVPFKERARAQAFAKEFGGRIVDYHAARASIAEAPAGMPNDGGTQ
jgi:copper chaperone NosL